MKTIINLLLVLFIILVLCPVIDYNRINYDVERVPELYNVFNTDEGSYIDVRNLRAQYSDGLLPSVENSVQFEYIRYKYF